MFRPEQIGKVNANPVGDHAPECLLITSTNTAQFVRDQHGFNRVQFTDGQFYRIERTDNGGPCYDSTLVTQEEYAGVELQEFERTTHSQYRLLPV